MNDYLSIGETANALGVSVPTLRRWDKQGKLSPDYRTQGEHRRYSSNNGFELSNIDSYTESYEYPNRTDWILFLFVEKR